MRNEKGQKPRLPEGARIGVEPPDRTEKMRFLCVYPKPGQQITCVILSDVVTWCLCHFEAKRSYLCEGAGCWRCAAGSKDLRKQGYLSIWWVGKEKPFILLVPAGLKMAFHDLGARKGGLRGLKVVLTRLGDEPNSACGVKLVDDWRGKTLPRGANLAYCIPVLFGYLPPEGLSEWDEAPVQAEQQQAETVQRLVNGIGQPPAAGGG